MTVRVPGTGRRVSLDDLRQPTRTTRGAAAALLTVVAFAASCCLAAAVFAIDQGRILRVLRQHDVPPSNDRYLPTGAISLPKLLEFISLPALSERRRYAHRAQRRRVPELGVSAFWGHEVRELTSYAIEFRTARGAQAALPALVQSTRASAVPWWRPMVRSRTGPRSPATVGMADA